MQTIRERLSLVLIGLLPFHALLVTVLTKWIAGPNQAPLSWLVLWKEALLGLVLVIGFFEIIVRLMDGGDRQAKKYAFDSIDLLIVALLLLAIVLQVISPRSLITSSFIFGFKYDFVPLVALIILRRLEWSKEWWALLKRVVLGSTIVLCVYGLLTLFLPASVFRALGYSDLHSLYVVNGPLAPFQQIGGSSIRRMQSAMSGPNQLGIWLLLPYSVVLVSLLQRFTIKKFLWRSVLEKLHLIKHKSIAPSVALLTLILVAIILTLSRSAWVAVFVLTLVALWRMVPTAMARTLIAYIFLVGAAAGVLLVATVPSVSLRLASSRDHVERPLEAMRTIISNPFGLGLGAAGPASNRVSDTCIELEEGSDAAWAADRPELCVFVGDTKVQPVDQDCNCPLLPENWYLQIGVELGVLGFVLYLLLIGIILKKLLANSQKLAPFYIFLGVSIAALFLHAWEDAAVAYSVWLIVAAASNVTKKA